MASVLAESISYNKGNVCGLQSGDVDAVGNPLLEADGGRTLLIAGSCIATFQPATDVTAASFAQDGECVKVGIPATINGYSFTLVSRGREIPGWHIAAGGHRPLYSADGALIGSEYPNPSEAGCPCPDTEAEVVYGGRYLVIWEQALDPCNNSPIADDDDVPIHVATVIPWHDTLVETTAPTAAAIADNNQKGRHTWTGTVKQSSNFGLGPGSAELVSDQTDTDPDEPEGITNMARFLTDIPFPGGCGCSGAGSWWETDDTPVPIGEVGWTAPDHGE